MPLPFRLTGVIIEFANGRSLIFDATFESVHERTAEITSSPVETDADVTDHRRRRPMAYRFTAIFLNEPYDALLANRRTVLGVGKDPALLPADLQLTPTRATDLHEDLVSLHTENSLFTMYTDFEVIENAMFETLDSVLIGHGEGVEVVGTIREVQFATTELETLPEQALRTSKKKKKKGTKSGEPASLEKLRPKDAFIFTVPGLLQ